MVEDTYLFTDIIKIAAGAIVGVIVGYLIGSTRRALPRQRPTVGSNFPGFTETSLLEILRSLSQTHRSIHNDRIKRELHIVITTLTFYAGAVSLKYTGKLPTDHLFTCSVWVGLLFLAGAAIIYLVTSAGANRVNQGLAEDAEDAMMALLQRAGIENFRAPEVHPAHLRWLWQVLVIVLGAVLAALVITKT